MIFEFLVPCQEPICDGVLHENGTFGFFVILSLRMRRNRPQIRTPLVEKHMRATLGLTATFQRPLNRFQCFFQCALKAA